MSSASVFTIPRHHGVLIADDDAEVRDVLHDKLWQEGFSVWLAADGQQAVNLYRSYRETIDVVLLDVCMPSLDGPQTLAALQEIAPQVCCCFMSGYLDGYTDRSLRDMGAAAVLAKPFCLAEVAQLLAELAGGNGADHSGSTDAGSPRRACDARHTVPILSYGTALKGEPQCSAQS